MRRPVGRENDPGPRLPGGGRRLGLCSIAPFGITGSKDWLLRPSVHPLRELPNRLRVSPVLRGYTLAWNQHRPIPLLHVDIFFARKGALGEHQGRHESGQSRRGDGITSLLRMWVWGCTATAKGVVDLFLFVHFWQRGAR
jgi:hypothetical protein